MTALHKSGMYIKDVAASPYHRVVLRCGNCPAPIRWEGAELAMRFQNQPDLTLVDLKDSAICPVCAGAVTVTVERSDD